MAADRKLVDQRYLHLSKLRKRRATAGPERLRLHAGRLRQKVASAVLPGRAEARRPLSRALALPATGPGTNPVFVQDLSLRGHVSSTPPSEPDVRFSLIRLTRTPSPGAFGRRRRCFPRASPGRGRRWLRG